MRNAETRIAALACAALWLSVAACDGSSKRSTDVGAVKMSLDIAGGATLDTIAYTISGPGSFMKAGSIDVSHSSTISADVSPLPPGMGFSIALSAVSTDGGTMCVGSAGFDVTAHQTTSVLVHVLCRQPTKNGSVSVNGALNVCPLIDSLGGSPSEVLVGGSIALTGQAHDTDMGPSPVTYQWTATSGTLSDAAAQNPTFTCAAAGAVTVTLTVSDGDSAPGCPDAQSITLTCTASTTGAGGTGGGAGTTGAAGTSGTAGTAGTAGTSGGAGTTGAAGTSGGAGTTGAAGTSGGAGTTGVAGTSGSAGTTGAGGSSAAVNVVVYRVGTGSGSLVNTGNAVFVDEFAPSGGAPVKSTALPTAPSGANHSLIASGTATSEGLLSRSADGKYVVLTGYDVTPGGATSLTGTTAARVVGRLDASGNVDTTTALTDFATGNNPRSVASSDGVNLWVAGAAGGARYATLGSTTSVALSTTLANLRQASIFGSQLYVSDSSGSAIRLGTVGAGLPTTSGQTITNLTGFPTAGSPYGFFFADLDGVAGVDTLYVADDSASAPGGVTKYSLVGGTWTANGSPVGAAADAYRGLTGLVSGGVVTLFATRKGGSGATGGGELVSIVDASGFNAPFSATPTLLATAAANTAFRGVALAPQP